MLAHQNMFSADNGKNRTVTSMYEWNSLYDWYMGGIGASSMVKPMNSAHGSVTLKQSVAHIEDISVCCRVFAYGIFAGHRLVTLVVLTWGKNGII